MLRNQDNLWRPKAFYSFYNLEIVNLMKAINFTGQ